MKNHFQLSDTDFERQFAEGTLSPALFTHEAHLRLAWIHLRRYGIEQAIDNIRRQLQQFTAKVGASGKYNETVTVAAIRAVHHFMGQSEADDFQDFIAEFPRLKHNFKALLAKHYKTDIIMSERARREYLEPELLPFD